MKLSQVITVEHTGTINGWLDVDNASPANSRDVFMKSHKANHTLEYWDLDEEYIIRKDIAEYNLPSQGILGKDPAIKALYERVEVNSKRLLLNITHTDLDGHMSGFIVTSGLGVLYPVDNIFFVNVDYGKEWDALNLIIKLKETHPDYMIDLVVTDLCLKQEMVDFISKIENVNPRILDHHITGKSVADMTDWYHLDDTKSATLISFNYVRKELDKVNIELGTMFFNSLVELVSYTNAYDIYKKDDMSDFNIGYLISEKLKEFKAFLPKEFSELNSKLVKLFIVELLECTNSVFPDNSNWFREVNTAALNAQEYLLLSVNPQSKFLIDNKSILMGEAFIKELKLGKDFTIVNVEDSDVLVAFNLPPSMKPAFDHFLYTEKTIDAYITISKNGSVGMFGNGTLNLGGEAKKQGGGGHRSACGFSLNQNNTKSIDHFLNYFKESMFK